MRLHISTLITATVLASTVWVFGSEVKEPASTVATSKPSQELKWLTSFKEAKEQAAKRKVPILVDFSGSDWCGWCVKLDQEVFSKPEFVDYASKNLVLLMVDFPRRKPQSEELKKQNETLSNQFGIQGFPTVLLLNSDGNVLAQTGYRAGGAEAYVKHLQDLLQKK